MIQGQFAVQSKIDIVQLLNSIGATDRYINDHQDKYHYVIHKINIASVFNRMDDSGFTQINMSTLREFLGSRYADTIMKELLSWGIIECDGIYKQGVKSYGYRIAPDYISKTILREVFKVETMGRKLKLQQREYHQVHRKDIRWKNLTQIGIHYREALSYIETQREQALQAATLPLATIESRYTTDLESIRKIANQEYFLEQPDPTSRLYTNLTNLSKELRVFLYNRKVTGTLVNIDIRNSQPYLFSLLLMDTYRGKDMPQDVQNYISLTSEGKFYEYLMEKLNVQQNERDSFKKTFFGKTFYCSSYYSKRTPEGKMFQELFPNVTTVINHYKEEGKKHYEEKEHKHLPITMQRREADFLLGTVGTELTQFGIWFNTIHDSVVCLEEHAERVKTLILEAFGKAVGVPPTLKQENFVLGL